MPQTNGETIWEGRFWRYESSQSNFDHQEWANNQLDATKEALAKMEIWEMFEKNGDKVRVNPDNVKKFLTELSNKNYNDIWRMFGGNTVPQTTAIQIALEMQGYDCWKIDWVLWNKTKAQIKKFQKDNWLDADWNAGPATIKKLVETFPDTTRTIPQRVGWATHSAMRQAADWTHDNVPFVYDAAKRIDKNLFWGAIADWL